MHLEFVMDLDSSSMQLSDRGASKEAGIVCFHIWFIEYPFIMVVTAVRQLGKVDNKGHRYDTRKQFSTT